MLVAVSDLYLLAGTPTGAPGQRSIPYQWLARRRRGAFY
jgi:hypothetical protein